MKSESIFCDILSTAIRVHKKENVKELALLLVGNAFFRNTPSKGKYPTLRVDGQNIQPMTVAFYLEARKKLKLFIFRTRIPIFCDGDVHTLLEGANWFTLGTTPMKAKQVAQMNFLIKTIEERTKEIEEIHKTAADHGRGGCGS